MEINDRVCHIETKNVVDIDENKKAKGAKKRVIKKIKLENCEHCLEVTQLEKKKNQLENKTDLDSLRENHEEFIKNKKSRSKLQQS